MSIVYDLIFLAVFVLVVWRGWRRGALATLLWLAGWIVAVVVIVMWGGIWSENIYSERVEPWAVETVEKSIPTGTVEAMNRGADAVVSVQRVLDSLDGVLGGRKVTVSDANEIEANLRQDSRSLAEGITAKVLGPVLKRVINEVVNLAILVVVLFVFRLLSRLAASRQGSHGILSRANRLLGGVLGALEAMAVVYALGLLLNLLANLLNVDWLNTTVLSETLIVSRII